MTGEIRGREVATAHARVHDYPVRLRWTGNTGEGTSSYRGYSRAHEISVPGKPPLPGSSDPVFRGDTSRYNPEELLVASVSACHMLWFLHLAADAGIVVTDYADEAAGRMVLEEDGGGRFVEVVLRPRVKVRGEVSADAIEPLHHRAHELCFIARSVAFPIVCRPETQVESRVGR
jgi:organic hydroperoxide reductase OsmC/OhrA